MKELNAELVEKQKRLSEMWKRNEDTEQQIAIFEQSMETKQDDLLRQRDARIQQLERNLDVFEQYGRSYLIKDGTDLQKLIF